jgi:hypothetical protein
MDATSRSLQDYSELCWHLAAQCKTRRAGRFMRMLAADLRLAAEKSRAAERRALAGRTIEGGNAEPAPGA